MPRIPVVAANPFRSNMINDYRFHAGQFSITLSELAFSGDDVKSFLQTQSTYDIDQLTDKTFHLVSFLDPQGRLECYGWIVLKDGKFSYLVPPSLQERTLQRLNKFLVSEDVEIASPVDKSFTFLIGPEIPNINFEASGILFDEKTLLVSNKLAEVPIISEEDLEKWRALNGWPSFDGSDFSNELFNNLRLFDLSLIQNKGCYPGQETVSKIASRRGAAYSPVLVEVDKKVSPGDVMSFDKKIGSATGCFEWQGKYYLTCSLLRDFRVEKMKLQFILNQEALNGKVIYYPLLPGSNQKKALELFYEATDHFKNEELALAEEKFRLSIKIDPTLADAYESLGVMLGRQERFQEAIDLMKQLSEVDPKSILAHTNMSLYLMRQGKIPEAEEQKSLATVKSFQSFGDEAKRKEVEASLKEKQQAEWAQRESMFQQVLEIDPDDTLANYGIGSIATEKGEWNLARTHLERVLIQDPKYSVAYLALGKALKGLGLIEEAKAIWKEGIKVAAAKGDLMPANQMQQELNF